jgi:RHS repeat-associated protein
MSDGLIFMKARYYDPAMGRFLTPDSLVASPYNPQNLSRYTYVDNNPINFTDPSGHWKWKNFIREIKHVAIIDVIQRDGLIWMNIGGHAIFGNDRRITWNNSWRHTYQTLVWEVSVAAIVGCVASGGNCISDDKDPPDNSPSSHNDYSGEGNGQQYVSGGDTIYDVVTWVSGAQAGEESAEWYADQYNEKKGISAAPYWVGGVLSAAWTPETAGATATVLSVGWGSAGWASRMGPTVEWRGGEIVLEKNGNRFLRVNPTGNWKSNSWQEKLPHYHRRPGIGKHRPWEGW